MKPSTTTPTSPAITSFEQFNLCPDLAKAITELGFTTPSPIQSEAIPLLLKKQTDFLGLAGTGTGKTAAFSIPLLEKLDQKVKTVQALILVPTRELAKQVSEQINLLARYKKTKAIAIYGGSNYGGQLRALEEGVSIVVGTPGRIIDHLDRKTLNLNHLKTVILDEADEMISMGFKEEIEKILETVNQEEKHQTWLFSATMSREVRKIADHFLDNPKQVQVAKTATEAATVKQYFYQVREEEKMEVIEKIIDAAPAFYGLIFCQTKSLVVDLTQSLKNHGYPADCLHGDMEQPARERAMKTFKDKKTTIVVCTDVASRGIDVKDLTHVINYSLPREIDLYVHRIGRTARGGKEGIALSLVTPSHVGLIRRTEDVMKSKMIRAQVPTDAELAIIKLKRALTDFTDVPTEGTLGVQKLEELIQKSEWKQTLESLSKEEIVARFLVRNFKTSKTKKPVDGPGTFAMSTGKAPRYRGERSRSERSWDRHENRSENREKTPVRSFAKPFAKPFAKKPASETTGRTGFRADTRNKNRPTSERKTFGRA